jgi:hypothetical protein
MGSGKNYLRVYAPSLGDTYRVTLDGYDVQVLDHEIAVRPQKKQPPKEVVGTEGGVVSPDGKKKKKTKNPWKEE